MSTDSKKQKAPQPIIGSIKNKIVASDLIEERKKASFDQKEMARIIWNGQDDYDRVLGIWKDLKEDPLKQSSEKWYDMSREEQQENAMKRLRRYYDTHREKYFTGFDFSYIPWWTISFQGLLPFGLTYTMFMSAAVNIGDDEQAKKWHPQIKAMKMSGCYAQTELGHGSFVPGIETTATFDRATQEFVINTPTITATKFWPGDMSKMSNHAIVFAKLIIDGKAYGAHAFMVQTRNMETWELLPGIECGDIGPKFGYNSKDNGYMIFKNVRIPRTDMLKRFAEVDSDGKIQLKTDMRRLYGIMLETRVWIAGNAGQCLAQALTIAGRYSVVRRQFSTQDGTKMERKLLDYQTHMFKFAPLLAQSYAMNFAAQDLFRNHGALVKELAKDEFGRLDYCHHLSAGYKAVFSRIAYDGIDSCRQACGGAGFSAHSGLPSLQVDYSPNTTYEGDNTVMLQQCARLMMKTWKQVHVKGNPQKAQGIFAYFKDAQELLSSKSTIMTSEDAFCLNRLEQALAVRAIYRIKRTMEHILKAEKDGVSDNERVHSLYAVDIVQMAHSHIMYVVFKIFRHSIESPDAHQKISCNGIKKNMANLLRMYALNELTNQDTSALYEAGYFSTGISSILLEASKKLMTLLRPQMIPLIEAWEFPDELLISAIGNSYGDIYETQLEWARNSRLNQSPMPKGFKEYFLPIVTGKL